MNQEFVQANLDISNEVIYNHTPSSLARDAFFYTQSLGHFLCNENYYTERMGYNSYLLIYTIKGTGYAKYRGKQYEMRPNQVLIMDCNDYQEYYTDKQDLWEMKWIHFNGGTSKDYFNLIYDNHGPLIQMPAGNCIAAQIDYLLDLKIEGDILFEVKASPVIVQMLTDIILAASISTEIDRRVQRNARVRAALEYIEKNYSKDILLDDIAKAGCCSKYNFSRSFKKATGFSPYEYLVKYRINEAKALLKTTEETIDGIAGAIGFKSTSSFIKTFRELESMTPLKYRKFWLR